MTGPHSGVRMPVDTKRPGTNARIVELRAKGKTYRAIADDVCVSKSHVERVIRAAESG